MLFKNLITLPLVAIASVSGLAVGDSDGSGLDNSLTKRSCYAAGAHYGNQIGLALEAVDKACRDKLVGTYKGKTERSACYDIGGGKRVNFNARRWHSSQADLNFDTCKKYLRLEIVGCPAGGISYQGNWRFM